MWRRGVSCKMRWLWTSFPSEELGCPAIQFQLSSSFNASQGLVTDAVVSRQWRTGRQMGGDGAILLKESLKVQILNALRTGDKKMGINLLKYLGSVEDCLAIDDLMSILEYCSKAPDPQFAVELWRFMEEKKLNIGQSGYLYIMCALCKGGYLDEALNLLKLLGENICTKPGLSIYNIFLNGCSQYNSLVHANKCLELMESKSIGKSEITYTELIKLAGHRQNISTVNQVWTDLNKFYSPNILSFRKLIQSLCRIRASAEANEALQKMVTVVSKGKSTLQISKKGRVCASKMDIPVPMKLYHGNMTESLIQMHPTEGLKDSAGLCVFERDVLSFPLSCKNGEAFMTRDQDILNQSQNDNVDIGSQLQLSSMNETKFESQSPNDTGKNDSQESKETTVNLPVDMEEITRKINGCAPNKQILYNECHSSTRNVMNEQPPAGECWFDSKEEEAASEAGESNVLNLKQISCIPALIVLRWCFNDVIQVAVSTRNYDLAERLFSQMHSIGLKPSLVTYNGFLKAVVFERGVIHGMKVVKAMENTLLKPNNITYATLAIGYSRSRDLDLAESMLDRMVDKEPQYTHAFNSLFTACRAVDEPERALRVLARMRHAKVKPNIRTYELLFSLFGNVNPPYESGNRQSQEDVSKRISAIEMDMRRNGVEHSQKSMNILLKALGAEGMVKELLRYLHVAEDNFNGRDAASALLLGTDFYNTVLHALVEAKERNVAIDIFEKMKAFAIKPDAATYNIMIDCCSLTGDLQSARALMATMLQDGFTFHACTYSILMKIALANNDFEAALDLFNEMKDEGIHSDVQCYNTILRSASARGRLDIIELLIEHMHRENIQPDPETCLHVFFSYYNRGLIDTALEALQVLSVRTISEDETIQREMQSTFEALVLDEDSQVEESLMEIFDDSKEYLAAALFNMRLCALSGVPNSWIPDKSPWAIQLCSQYDQIVN